MLWRIGTVSDALALDGIVPDDVHNDIVRGLAILDDEYGSQRNYLSDGGYALIAENNEDVRQAIKLIGESRLCEWVTRLGASGWINVLYLLGDDYAIVLYAPESALPTTLLNRIEEDKQ